MEIRATQEGKAKKLVGYAATYNTISRPIRNGKQPFLEKILPGAFDNVLRQPETVMTVNHNQDFVLGRVGAGTLKLTTDAKGLRFECLLPDTQTANELYTAVQRGDMAGCSFAFDGGDVEDRWDETEEPPERGIISKIASKIKRYIVRTISKFNTLVDVSIVTTPAYPNTSVSARSLVAAAEFRSSFAAELWRNDVSRADLLGIALDLPSHKRADGEALFTVVQEARNLAAKAEITKYERRRFIFLVSAIMQLKRAKRSLAALELDYRNEQLARLGESTLRTLNNRHH